MGGEDKTMNQSRVGVEGAGGGTRTGEFFKRSNVRTYFVGGLAGLGLAWFLTSYSKSPLIKGTKVPTVPYETDKEHPEGPTWKTGHKVTSPHGGVAGGQSEGAKPRV